MTLLLQEISRARSVTSRRCPFCGLPMKEFRNEETALTLDACKACRVVWFDAQEFEQATERGREAGRRGGRARSAGGTEGLSFDDTLTVEVVKSLTRFLCLPF